MEQDYCSYVIKILFNLNSQGNEEFELFSQGTYDFQNFRNEILYIADHDDIKNSVFDCLTAKLWFKERTSL